VHFAAIANCSSVANLVQAAAQGNTPGAGFLTGSLAFMSATFAQARPYNCVLRLSVISARLHSLSFTSHDMSSFHITPKRGGWSADRRTLYFLCRACDARPPRSRGDRDPSRRSTVAISGCGPTLRPPGSGTGAAATVPRQALCLAVGVRSLPAVRFAPRPRDATPGSVLQDRF
jgi:hypothetical protein